MERIKVSRNFYLDEYVDPHTYFKTVDNGVSLIDDRLFDVGQLLRYLYGKPISINNWWAYYLKYKNKLSIEAIIINIENSRTLNKWSGLRTPRTTIGSPTSAHRPFSDGVCKAIDPKGNEIELYNIVKNNAECFYNLGVRRLEDPGITEGWLHTDLLEKYTKPNSIRVIDRTSHVETIYF